MSLLALVYGSVLAGCGHDADTKAAPLPAAAATQTATPTSPVGPPDFGLPPLPAPEKLSSMTPEEWAAYLSQGDEGMKTALVEGSRKAQEQAPKPTDPVEADKARAFLMFSMRDAAMQYRLEHEEYPSADGHFERARQLDAAGYEQRAVVHYRKAVEKDPRHAMAWAGLGRDLAYVGEKDKALEAYQKALELAPDRPGWYKELGEVFESQARFDDALQAYRRAVELKPDYGEAFLRMAVTQWRAKRYAEAKESLASAQRFGAQPPAGFAERLEKDAKGETAPAQ